MNVVSITRNYTPTIVRIWKDKRADHRVMLLESKDDHDFSYAGFSRSLEAATEGKCWRNENRSYEEAREQLADMVKEQKRKGAQIDVGVLFITLRPQQSREKISVGMI